jgi:hypothetical protein
MTYNPSFNAATKPTKLKTKDTAMKTQNNNSAKFTLNSGFALALAFAIWLPATARAQDEMKPMKGSEHMMMGSSTNTLTQSCQAMMQMHQKMMDEMKTQDAALTEQVAKMNSAPENEKTAMMADIVTKMVEQRTANNAKMEKMHAQMMQHMMEHMEMGKESMMQCPMMKGMGGMKGMDANEDQK